MDPFVIFSYALIIVGILVWVVLLPSGKRFSDKTINYINIFGGAFLLASCFINLVPHMFLGDGENRFVTPNLHFKIAAAVLVGFLIQLFLELLTHGAEHGHDHKSTSSHSHHDHNHPHHDAAHPLTALFIGLCIHAFLEGMPLVASDGDIHQGLLYGIVLHNIPISLVLLTLFMNNGYGFWRSFLLLALFAVMTPLGSLCNMFLIPPDEMLQGLIMGVVVGILLHVSVSILFDEEHNSFSFSKLLLILIAFVAAYFTPGCPEIYPIL